MGRASEGPGRHYRSATRWILWVGMAVALPALGGCVATGSGPKKSGFKLKTYRTKHPLSVPAEPVRHGRAELRVTEVYLEEHATVLETTGWQAHVRCVLVNPDDLPMGGLSGVFTLIGTSGKTYPAHAFISGDSWERRQEGEQIITYLPASVPGEVDVWAQVGDGEGHDGLAAFTFHGVEVPIGP